MWPFYNTAQPFGFVPFGLPFGRRRSRVKTLSGIPVLSTTGIITSTTDVRFNVNQCEFRSLPNEGVFFLDVKQSGDAASATLPVGFANGESTIQSNLINAQNEPVTAGELLLNIRYLIYYSKSNNTYQLVNAYPTATT